MKTHFFDVPPPKMEEKKLRRRRLKEEEAVCIHNDYYIITLLSISNIARGKLSSATTQFVPVYHTCMIRIFFFKY